MESFDVSPEGVVVGVTKGKVVDVVSGDELLSSDNISSVAFASGAMAIATIGGDIGYYDGERSARHVGRVLPTPAITSSTDYSSLLAFRKSNDATGRVALAALAEGESWRGVTTSFVRIDAAGAHANRIYFATQNALFLVISDDNPVPVLVLPEETGRFRGIAVADRIVYFATNRGIFAFEDGLAIPLVLGLTGPIRLSNGALFVLNDDDGRIYRVVLAS